MTLKQSGLTKVLTKETNKRDPAKYLEADIHRETYIISIGYCSYMILFLKNSKGTSWIRINEADRIPNKIEDGVVIRLWYD